MAVRYQKILVVYYSLEGHCHRIAEHLSQKFGFDTLALEPIKDLDPHSSSKYILGRLQIIFNKTVRLQRVPENINDYDLIIIGTPVWANTYAPAVQAFIDLGHLASKKVALFSTYDKDAGQVFLNFEEKLKDCDIIGEEAIDIKNLDDNEIFERIDNWMASILD